MRDAASFLVVSAALIGTLPSMAGEESSPVGFQPKQRYTVRCRWIREHDDYLDCPALTLCDGARGSICDTSQSPFVTGVTRSTGPAYANQPHIVVLDEGLKIDLIVSGRQPHGASVDVTVEQSKITRVDTKPIDSDTWIQIPVVDIRKKRVFDFVEFGSPLVVALGEKHAGGTVPRLEIVVSDGANVRPDCTARGAGAAATPGNLQSKAVLDAILATGGAKVLCQRVSRWEEARGRELDADLGRFKALCDCASVCSFAPHRAGMVDVLALLSPAVHNPAWVRAFEEAVFGCVPGYSALLWDSPSLVRNVELLGRLPWLWDVTIRTSNPDPRLLHAVKGLRVLHRLEVYKTPDDERHAGQQQEEEDRLGIQQP